MTRALIAVGKSQLRPVLERLHLDHAETTYLLIALALEHASTAGIDRRGILALVDDMLAATAVEGGGK